MQYKVLFFKKEIYDNKNGCKSFSYINNESFLYKYFSYTKFYS